MNGAYLCLWVSVVSVLVAPVEPLEPLTMGAAVVVGATSLLGLISDYNYNERCNSAWIDLSYSGLKADLDNKLIGQHIASPLILKAVSGFMSSPNPQKPLVLSLHGTAGTGKNFVSSLIANNIYHRGMDSSFVHLFTATKHFPHSSQVASYKEFLRNHIENSVAQCERSMFIFDEMDKMHPGVMDVIKPYVEYYSHLDRVSYNKAIFLFLSNAGGESITKTALDFQNSKRGRETIELSDVEESISLAVFNNHNTGFFRTSLIERSLVDFYVPFLPLEHRHVVQCVLNEMRSRGLRPNPHVAEKLAWDLVYFPKSEKVFSSMGCKTIGNKLPFYL